MVLSSFFHRAFSRRVLLAIIFVVIIGAGSYLWFLSKVPVPSTMLNFRVEQTDSVHDIGRNLVARGVIKHRLFFYFAYYFGGSGLSIRPGGYNVSNTMTAGEVIRVLQSGPARKIVVLPVGVDKQKIADILADALGWDLLDRQFFSHTYAGMQWQYYHDAIRAFFEKEYGWNDKKTQTFLTLSALYYDQDYDFLKKMYVPGAYDIPIGYSRAQVAGMLLDRFIVEHRDDQAALDLFIDRSASQAVASLVEEQMILMPDIVALPPLDVTLKKK